MKPNKLNSHGRTDTAINPLTGRRYDWETSELAKHAEKNEIARQRGLIEAQMKVMALKDREDAARKSLLEFTKYTMPDPAHPSDPDKTLYEATRMHQAIAADLTAFVKGEMKNEDGSTCTQLIF